jgi:hypothetical protein
VPNIERRYNAKIWASKSAWPNNFSFWRWSNENAEISLYIVSKVLKQYINWELSMVKNPMEGTYLSELKRINYDIKRAEKVEIILSFLNFIVTAICVVFFAALAVQMINAKNNSRR